MDRRGWPWKKKSSDKIMTDKTVATSDSSPASLASVGSLSDKESYKKINYVQVSVDSYTHMSGFEAQVKVLEEQVKDLNKKLSEAHTEITKKENLVEQHAKVAEEAVSGWEKADAEALALKRQLESITFLKLTAEDRASHLDGALKECVRQIRSVKEESEQKLHEVIHTKTKQWDKIKLELDGKIVELDQEILKSTAENSALTRSLQEHSNMLMKINEEKSQVEANIEHLKGNIQSYEKEISSLKYELQVVSKELDIRNEEKNMSVKLAEVANKQHSECGKKIAKLEAECQRLRGLVRKKLPGPAALAQMKLEVENLGQGFSEPRLRTTVKSPNPRLSPLTEFSDETLQQYQKEIEFLTTRLLTMEEETKMLKEALATRNHELQTSRSICAKVASRLKNLEAQQDLNQQRGSPKSNFGISTEGSSSKNASKSPSLASMSEDGIDEASSAECSATSLISHVLHSRRDISIGKSSKHDNSNHLDLMDDFLEMERLACLSNNSNLPISIIKNLNNTRSDVTRHSASIDAAKSGNLLSEWPIDSNPSPEQVSSSVDSSTIERGPRVEHLSFLKLQSRISAIIECQTKDTNMGKILAQIKYAMQDIQGSICRRSTSSFSKGAHPDIASYNWEACPQDTEETKDSKILLNDDGQTGTDKEQNLNPNLVAAVSQIHQFVLSLGMEAMQVSDTSTVRDGISKKIEDFSTSVDKFIVNKISLMDLFLDLSHVLIKTRELKFSVLDNNGCEGEITSTDCIDKVALPENNDSSRHRVREGCDQNSFLTSHPEILQERTLSSSFGFNLSLYKCSLKELELLKSDKDDVEMDLARRTQDLENTRLQLKEMDQLLTEMKSQLASKQKASSLAETQLKCVTESYKSLELHARELEAEVSLLREKIDNLNCELQDEKANHRNALARCKDLQEQLQRLKNYSMSSVSSVADLDINSKQEREIAAAAEKLAECQETIHILGKQLKALQPQSEITASEDRKRLQMSEGGLVEDKPDHGGTNKQAICCSNESDQADIVHASSATAQGQRKDFSSNSNSPSSPPEIIEPHLPVRSLINPGHRHEKHNKSASSSAVLVPEKHLRGFSSFFASKVKHGNGH